SFRSATMPSSCLTPSPAANHPAVRTHCACEQVVPDDRPHPRDLPLAKLQGPGQSRQVLLRSRCPFPQSSRVAEHRPIARHCLDPLVLGLFLAHLALLRSLADALPSHDFCALLLLRRPTAVFWTTIR